MNARQRFNAIMHYRKTDGVPAMLLEPFEGYTLERWREQGMPEGAAPEVFLGLDVQHNLRISFSPIPVFQRQILFEDDQYIVDLDWMGTTVRRDKRAPGMYYGHIDHPVKTKDDWLRYRERFQFDRSRYLDDLDTMAVMAEKSENPVSLGIFPFFMRLGFYGMGLERFLTGFYDEPALIHEMFSYWNDFVIQVISPALKRIRPDVVTLNEDLAFKNGPHFSPAIYKEFWLPYQNRLMRVLNDANVPLICQYSSGDFRALLPLMIENGFNTIWPLDQYSGMDPYALRREYGSGLRMAGGISKQTLIDGPDAIDRRLDALMPLIRQGGFIPSPDDMIPPEVPLANMIHLVKALRAIRL